MTDEGRRLSHSARPVVYRSVRTLILAVGLVCLATAAATAGRDDQRLTLDSLLAAYLNGDTAGVARGVASSGDFQALGLGNPRALDRWLGDWHRAKAVLLLELAAASTVVAPQYTRPLLGAGRRYLARRPAESPNGAIAGLWHRVAVGLLQHMGTPSVIEEYLDGVGDDPRFVLARAVAHERRCRSLRPEFDPAGADIRDAARRSKSAVRVPNLPAASTMAQESDEWLACLAVAVARFESAAALDDTRAEARVRGGWLLAQQGDLQRALEWLESVEPGDDHAVAYWAALFRGRVLDRLGRHHAAAEAYASALTVCPDAQSAGIGFALALMRSDRGVEADEFARTLRTRTAAVADPWWIYGSADHRFVEHWISELRAAVR
jgi:tetratricopeptide (TPR) repeat protein